MRTHVALFRAVNVSGTGKLPMAALRVLAGELGFGEAATVLQSGSLVFAASGSSAALADTLDRALVDRFGLSTTIIMRTAAEWAALVAVNPYGDAARDAPAHMHLMPLSDTPKPGAIDDLRAAIKGRESVELIGQTLYSVYPDGVGESKLTIGVIERKLGAKTTGRNWNTTLKIAALFEGLGCAADHLIATVRLGFVDGLVGALQERVRRVALADGAGDAHRNGH